MIQAYTENQMTNFYILYISEKTNSMGGSAFVDGFDKQNICCLTSTMSSVH